MEHILLCDGHAHLGSVKEISERKKQKIKTFLSGTTKEECEQIELLQKESLFCIPTYGLHPWNSQTLSLEELMPYLMKCPIIGEIGMDSTWCDVPLSIQKKVFTAQLELAKERNVPVILHTKGQEKEVFSCIKEYSIPFLVHWYSCDDYLEQYRKKDCYFTIGPDVEWNTTVQKVVKSVDIKRLLVETDGLSAVLWAAKEGKQNEKGLSITQALSNSIRYIAKIKNLTWEKTAEQILYNFHQFYGDTEVFH